MAYDWIFPALIGIASNIYAIINGKNKNPSDPDLKLMYILNGVGIGLCVILLLSSFIEGFPLITILLLAGGWHIGLAIYYEVADNGIGDKTSGSTVNHVVNAIQILTGIVFIYWAYYRLKSRGRR